jgi:electron transport complex protein RnfC
MKKLNGVHLNHHKNTENYASVNLPLPEKVSIPMNMNIGAPCKPLVKVGDTVCVGQKIGDTDAFMSVPVHSSVSGKVKKIANLRMSNGRYCPSVEIETDGLLSKDDFIKAIRESGLVGMGGASFPTHIKLSPKQKIDTLVINAAECEPYITSDYRQMIENPDEVVDGIENVLKWLDISKAVIGIENNKPKAIEILKNKTVSKNNIEVFSLPSTYPQGAEKVLIYNTLNRVVQEGQLPADCNVIVLNVSSVAFISRYLKTGMPMIQRTVTVDGDVVNKPCNVVVPFGTPVKNVLEFAKCDIDKADEILYGGPMMGISIMYINDPILKANNAILAFKKHKAPKASACIHCGRCMSSCPLNLMPTEFAKAFRNKDVSALGKLKITLCMNCGSCTYSCPAKRPVAENNQLAKAFYMTEIKKQEVK